MHIVIIIISFAHRHEGAGFESKHLAEHWAPNYHVPNNNRILLGKEQAENAKATTHDQEVVTRHLCNSVSHILKEVRSVYNGSWMT